MAGPVRPPAPACALEGCAEPARWSVRSRRYVKYCTPEHAAPASRGSCNAGKHPRPQSGERCKECKAEWSAARQPPPRPKAKPKVEAAPLPLAVPVVSSGRAWRPAGIGLCPARGGPDDPRWTVA